MADALPARYVIGATASLLALLVGLGVVHECGQRRVVVDLSLTARTHANTSGVDSGEAYRYSPSFVVARPTTLAFRTTMPAAQAGVLAVDLALLEEATGEVREFSLISEAKEDARKSPALEVKSSPLEGEGRVDQVGKGRYTIRYRATWTAAVADRKSSNSPHGPAAPTVHKPPPNVRLVVTRGARSPALFVIALGLVLLPPCVWAWRRYRPRSFQWA